MRLIPHKYQGTLIPGAACSKLPAMRASASAVLLLILLGSPVFGKKQKEPPTPTQQDMRFDSCLAVKEIVFRPQSLFGPPASVSGTVASECLRDAQVSISVSFYDRSGAECHSDIRNLLVLRGSRTEFRVYYNAIATQSGFDPLAAQGRVTLAFALFQ